MKDHAGRSGAGFVRGVDRAIGGIWVANKVMVDENADVIVRARRQTICLLRAFWLGIHGAGRERWVAMASA